jgi:hypothetical protein
MVSPDILLCCFVHRRARKLFWHIWNPHNQTLYAYPEPSNQHLGCKNELFGALWRQKPAKTSWNVFGALNDHCSPQDNCTVESQVSMVRTVYFMKILNMLEKISSMPVKEIAMQNIRVLRKKSMG